MVSVLSYRLVLKTNSHRIPPPATKEKHNFAELETIDLSKLDGDEEAQRKLVADVKRAIREDGFLFLENYGVSLEQLHRQFSIAHYLFNNISEEDKERLLFHPSTGRWAGWKHEYGFKRHRQQKDGINQFNWYKEQWENDELLPACILPFMDEIRAFSEVCPDEVSQMTDLTATVSDQFRQSSSTYTVFSCSRAP